MEYLKITIHADCSETEKDILMYNLTEIGFDSFEETSMGFVAYIDKNIFNEKSMIALLSNDVKYRIDRLEDKNWNQIWEQNFNSPVSIADKVHIHSSANSSDKKMEYDIIIDPKQSFGSGNHTTTCMIVEKLLDIDLNNLSVLDVGSGTGVLSILASKLKAKEVVAIDIDKWAYNNTIENAAANNAPIKAVLGQMSDIDQTFDLILSNLNTNLHIDLAESYCRHLNTNGMLIVSGFYNFDRTKIDKAMQKNNLRPTQSKESEEWLMLCYQKIG